MATSKFYHYKSRGLQRRRERDCSPQSFRNSWTRRAIGKTQRQRQGQASSSNGEQRQAYRLTSVKDWLLNQLKREKPGYSNWELTSMKDLLLSQLKREKPGNNKWELTSFTNARLQQLRSNQHGRLAATLSTNSHITLWQNIHSNAYTMVSSGPPQIMPCMSLVYMLLETWNLLQLHGVEWVKGWHL